MLDLRQATGRGDIHDPQEQGAGHIAAPPYINPLPDGEAMQVLHNL